MEESTTSKGKPQGSKVLSCKCFHAAQDTLHGISNRVHNACKKENGIGYRCTVCGTVRSA
jgi:hypothetical protein